MFSTKQSIIDILDELPPGKRKALFYFAEWLSEENELTPEELLAPSRGKKQFEKGDYAFFEDIKRG